MLEGGGLVGLGLWVLLAALVLIGLWMVMQRLRLVEERVRQVPRPADFESLIEPVRQELQSLSELQRGLDDLADRVASLPAPLQDEALAPIREDLKRLDGQLQTLTQRLEQVARTAAQSPETGQSSVSSRLRRHLEGDGFVAIKLLMDLEDADSEEPLKVPVEARRQGASYKGTVTVEAGRVTDVSLQPSYEAFP